MATREKIDKDLRDIVVWMKYAQYLPQEERRETYEEIITRVERMYLKKLPQAKKPLQTAFGYVRKGFLLPSMRAMHFAGEGIERNNARIYNCSAVEIQSTKDLADTMFLLLSGCGVGVGIENTRFEKKDPSHQHVKFVVPDSTEGWAESFQVLLDGWVHGDVVEFDYSDIRPKGAPIKSINALAPGAKPLKEAHKKITALIDDYVVLSPFMVLRILCLMSQAVMSGGIRRSAMIAIVSDEDKQTIQAKQDPEWFTNYPELQYVNISVGWRHPWKPSQKAFTQMFSDALQYGEPGFYNFAGKDWLTNPCGEILLQSNQFCNLVEVNATKLTPRNQQEVFSSAALLGFVQSRFTDFHFLSPEWKKTTEKDRLVGVSLTGISGMQEEVDLTDGARAVKDTLDRLNLAFGEGTKVPRYTTVKPAGHTSLLLGTSSGIHSYPSPFYKRRVTIQKDTAMGQYLKRALPQELLEEDIRDENNYKLVIPMRAPRGAACQTDPAEWRTMLDRIEHVNKTWIDNHTYHATNNISATLSVPEEDIDDAIRELYKGTGIHHKGITVLKQTGHMFDQPVWEPIKEPLYRDLCRKWPTFLSTKLLMEVRNNTDLGGEVACSAGGCEIT